MTESRACGKKVVADSLHTCVRTIYKKITIKNIYKRRLQKPSRTEDKSDINTTVLFEFSGTNQILLHSSIPVNVWTFDTNDLSSRLWITLFPKSCRADPVNVNPKSRISGFPGRFWNKDFSADFRKDAASSTFVPEIDATLRHLNVPEQFLKTDKASLVIVHRKSHPPPRNRKSSNFLRSPTASQSSSDVILLHSRISKNFRFPKTCRIESTVKFEHCTSESFVRNFGYPAKNPKVCSRDTEFSSLKHATSKFERSTSAPQTSKFFSIFWRQTADHSKSVKLSEILTLSTFIVCRKWSKLTPHFGTRFMEVQHGLSWADKSDFTCDDKSCKKSRICKHKAQNLLYFWRSR